MTACKKCKKEIADGSRFCNHCGARQAPVKRAHKRAHGTGSVYKLSGTRKKPWYAVRAAIWSADGNAVRFPLGTFETKAKAEEALARDALTPVSEYGNITLKNLFEMWKSTRAYMDLSKQTQDNYKAAMAYLAPYHNIKFADLRTAHFQEAIDRAEKMGRSRSTMEKIRAIASLLSKYAYSQDITQKNYASTIRLPQEVKKSIPTFTDIEIEKLFNNDGLEIADTILILIYTGMRIEELLSLTKFNIDIDKMLITGGIKTDVGKDRIIPIHPRIQQYITARYKSSKNYLLERKNGARYYYSKYCSEYYAVLEKLGIRHLTPHKARHTFFTRLSDRCADRKGMAIVGGHTDPNFTEKTYVQPDIERLRKVIECL